MKTAFTLLMIFFFSFVDAQTPNPETLPFYYLTQPNWCFADYVQNQLPNKIDSGVAAFKAGKIIFAYSSIGNQDQEGVSEMKSAYDMNGATQARVNGTGIFYTNQYINGIKKSSLPVTDTCSYSTKGDSVVLDVSVTNKNARLKNGLKIIPMIVDENGNCKGFIGASRFHQISATNGEWLAWWDLKRKPKGVASKMKITFAAKLAPTDKLVVLVQQFNVTVKSQKPCIATLARKKQ